MLWSPLTIQLTRAVLPALLWLLPGGSHSARFDTTLPREHVKEFSCGRLYYRLFYLDARQDVLYVGAMDKIFRLSLININRTRCEADSITLPATNVASCVSKGKSEHYDCRNHIRVIQPIQDGSRLYVCGTNAHHPMDMVINANLTRITPLIWGKGHESQAPFFLGLGDGIAKCPFDPEDNATAVWVERGNPSNLPGLYSGTVAEFTKADTVIFRTNLYNGSSLTKPTYNFKRTIKYDSKWLDKPHFVGAYDIGEYVYFFFRESAVEYINCGKSVYSRVARVCKRDTGGKNILNKNWASFLKARLNCSIPGEFPFYFNEIQSIYRHPDDERMFYGVFTTSMNGLMGSAICTFTLDAIEEVFAGKFKEQATSSSAWLPVLSSKVPEPRPGLCVNDTQTLPDSVLNFIRSHPLMDSAVAQASTRGPVFYRRDVIFSRLVVDRLEVDGVVYTVYYVGTNRGAVYKLVEWQDPSRDRRSNLVDVLDVTAPEPIRAMEISSKWSRKSLYVASDSGIKQLDLVMCRERYDSCIRCIQDPYCGWDKDRGECKPYVTGYLQDVTNATPGACDNSIKSRPMRVYWGQSVHLSCPVHFPDSYQTPQWYHFTRDKGKVPVPPPGGTANDKYIATADHGLVIITVTEREAGRYACKMGTAILCSYNITVDTKSCTTPSETDYRKIYSDWCHEFEKYKSAMKIWQNKQAKCQLTHPNDVAYQGSI